MKNKDTIKRLMSDLFYDVAYSLHSDMYNGVQRFLIELIDSDSQTVEEVYSRLRPIMPENVVLYVQLIS